MREHGNGAAAEPARPTVVQFGAGAIGRGFMGQLFAAGGYETVFVDVQTDLLAALNARGSYPLRLVGPTRHETLTIAPVRAVDARDTEAVAAEVARCVLACTAVGVAALPHVAPAIAAGVRQRADPLHVLLCENQLHCADLMRGLLAPLLETPLLGRVGLVEVVVGRMVPLPRAERADPLEVVAEDYAELPVNAAGLAGELPPVPGLRVVQNFTAHVERKLYLHNMAHALAAYLGALHGCPTIHAALAHPEVAAAVTGAMAEAGEALCRKHGFPRDEMRRHAESLRHRFANPELRDSVERVGRDPIRKLRPEDRLIGAARLCLDEGVEPVHIALGIAAALRFSSPGDTAAMEIQRVVVAQGWGEALYRYTGTRADSELGRLVVDAAERLPSGG